MPKRKSAQVSDALQDAPQPRRSTRQKTSASAAASPAPPASQPKSDKKKTANNNKQNSSTASFLEASSKAKGTSSEDEKPTKKAPASKPIGKKQAQAASTNVHVAESSSSRQYWLMKAEPETRYESGVDISFSIDDLAAKTKPEPWDGIRNYVARNNLRAMKKGDLAFFSHSNCKEPGIVGTMEIVEEASPDLSAHDSKNPYYDPKSSESDPRWSVVHVEFRSKLPVPVTLKEMRTHAGSGGPLADMQMMKQSRLSVSRVSAAEWEFLTGLAEEKAKAAKAN